MSLKFKCPKCSHEELEIIQTDVVVSSKVVDIDEEGYFEFEQIELQGGDVDRYQCFKCGYVLKNASEQAIITEDEVVDWIQKNSGQGKKN